MSITLAVARKRWKEENDRIIKLVKMTMAVTGLSQEEYAMKLGITGRTLRNRIQNPNEFRQIETQTIRYLAEVHGVQTA